MSRISESFAPQPYGGTPGYKEPTTSKDAASAMKTQAKNLRALTLAAIEAAGFMGLSADEVAAKLNQTVLAIRPRITELGPKHLNLIERTGFRRKNVSGLNAAVWRKRIMR